MTLKELYSEIWLDITPSISDDSVLDERIIKFYIHKTRALFARNEMDKTTRTVDAALIQNLGLVELEAVDDFVPSGLTNISHKVLRTVKTIPRAIELRYKQAFTYIGPLSQTSKGFKLVDMANVPYTGSGKFNRTFMYAFLMNDHIYIIGDCNNTAFKGLKYINVKGVFENPEEAGKFYKEDGSPCYTDESQYPLPAYMWNYIKKEILQSDLRQFYVPLEDISNNSNNDITKVSIPDEKAKN